MKERKKERKVNLRSQRYHQTYEENNSIKYLSCEILINMMNEATPIVTEKGLVEVILRVMLSTL